MHPFIAKALARVDFFVLYVWELALRLLLHHLNSRESVLTCVRWQNTAEADGHAISSADISS